MGLLFTHKTVGIAANARLREGKIEKGGEIRGFSRGDPSKKRESERARKLPRDHRSSAKGFTVCLLSGNGKGIGERTTRNNRSEPKGKGP